MKEGLSQGLQDAFTLKQALSSCLNHLLNTRGPLNQSFKLQQNIRKV